MQPNSVRESVNIQGEPIATELFVGNVHIGDVVLIHGFTGSKEDFAELAPLVADEGFRVLTFDNRGQHQSAHSLRADAYGMESLALDVNLLSEYFGFNSPHLMGHSFGGLIAQQALVQSPRNWATLTLMCSGPGGRSSWLEDPQFTGLTNESKERIWDEVLAPDRLNHPRYDLLRRRWIASDAVSTMKYRDHLRNQNSLIQRISDLAVPAHVIYGEHDDAWPIAEQNVMAKELRAAVTVLPGLGHCPNEEDPLLTTRGLVDFWRPWH